MPSTKGQYAAEANGGGVFTGLLIDALGGAAANLVGKVTPGGVYAYIDQSLGTWSQRPVFKTNVKTFVSLRQVQPPLALEDLQRISEFFPDAGFEFQLDLKISFVNARTACRPSTMRRFLRHRPQKARYQARRRLPFPLS